MRSSEISARLGKMIVLTLLLTFSPSLIGWADEAPAKLEATIFSYDGHDFVRVKTTLLTKEGKSAVNTKLEHDTAAYKALANRHSYSGDATVFGHKYEANYAPLVSEDGRLTGALFVAVAK
jgi:Cache 3/Cache 2 fusion domain